MNILVINGSPKGKYSITLQTLEFIKNIELQKLSNNGLKARLLVYETVNGKELCACIKPSEIRTNTKIISAWIAVGKNITFGGCDGIASPVIFS